MYKRTLMEKCLVFILLAIFHTRRATPVLVCESNSDCDQAGDTYCCKKIKQCRSSCDLQDCTSNTDCGSPDERCFDAWKQCLPVSPSRTKSKDDRTPGVVIVIVAIGLSMFMVCCNCVKCARAFCDHHLHHARGKSSATPGETLLLVAMVAAGVVTAGVVTGGGGGGGAEQNLGIYNSK